jgi:hypothetical protein
MSKSLRAATIGVALLAAQCTGARALDAARFTASLKSFSDAVGARFKATGRTYLDVTDLATQYFDRDVPLATYAELFKNAGFSRTDSWPPQRRFTVFIKPVTCGRWFFNYCEIRIAFYDNDREITSVRGHFFDMAII